jgi:glycosyltransferase involved in cell wall biosynthesis
MSAARVLFVEHHSTVVGGGQISLLELMRQLEHFQPLYVCGAEGDMTEAVRRAQIPVAVMDMPPLRPASTRRALAAVRWLARLARQQEAVLLHANSSRAMFYAGLAGKLAGLPVVWHVRVVQSDGWRDQLLAHGADRIIAISRAVEQRFARQPAAGKVRVIHNGVDLESFSRAKGTALRARLGCGESPLVGMVAQLIPWKRHADFIRAMARVAGSVPQARFLIAGAEPQPRSGYESELRKLVRQMGLEERFAFLGFYQEIAEVMAMLDVAVLTSENEPFGRVLIEAMAAGKPVVATAGGGVPEIVVDGQTGLLVPLGDVEAIAGAVVGLLGHPERAQAMGQAGRCRAQERFSIQAHARAVEALYREVVDR